MTDDASPSMTFESAHDATKGSIPLPNPTPGILEARGDSTPDQVPPPTASGAKDNRGTVFDPFKHETDPATGLGRLSAQGAWKLKRGNGARVAAGRPLAGATHGKLVLPASEAHNVENPAPGSTPGAAAPASLPPGVTLQSVQTVPPPAPPPIAEADYANTALGVSHATWGVFRLLGGPRWEADKDEISAWSKCWQRIWAHYQLPLIGPVVELVILGVQAAAKRTDGTKAKSWIAGAWRWAKGGKFSEPETEAAA